MPDGDCSATAGPTSTATSPDCTPEAAHPARGKNRGRKWRLAASSVSASRSGQRVLPDQGVGHQGPDHRVPAPGQGGLDGQPLVGLAVGDQSRHVRRERAAGAADAPRRGRRCRAPRRRRHRADRGGSRRCGRRPPGRRRCRRGGWPSGGRPPRSSRPRPDGRASPALVTSDGSRYSARSSASSSATTSALVTATPVPTARRGSGRGSSSSAGSRRAARRAGQQPGRDTALELELGAEALEQLGEPVDAVHGGRTDPGQVVQPHVFDHRRSRGPPRGSGRCGAGRGWPRCTARRPGGPRPPGPG